MSDLQAAQAWGHVIQRLKQAKTARLDTTPYRRLNILLAGLSGTGKSSTANRIFGAELCPVGTFGSVTTTPNICKAVVKQDVFDFTLTIVDSPGLKDTRGYKQDIENLAQTKALLQRPEYKPDIVLITFDSMNTRLSGDALREPILSLKKTFESLINWRMVIVLFTRAGLYAGPVPFEMFMEQATKTVQHEIFEATGVPDVPCMAVENGPGVPWTEKVEARGVDWIHELTVNTMAPMLSGPVSLKAYILALMIDQGPALKPVRIPEEEVQRLLDPVKVASFKTDVSLALEAVRKTLRTMGSGLAIWLSEHRLEQYADAFDDAGYDEVADLRSHFTEDKLIDAMQMKPGHAAKMARELNLPVSNMTNGYDVLPGFSTLGQGYNARTGLFSRPLLDLNASRCLTVTEYGDQTFALPAPLQPHYPDEANSMHSFVRVASEMEQRHKAARLGVQFHKGMFAMDADIGYGHASSSVAGAFICSTSSCHALFGAMLPSSRRDIGGYITDEFKEDVRNLPHVYDEQTSEQFYQFFDKWGTHYVQTCDFGGSITVDISISSRQIFDPSNIYTTAKASLSTLFQVDKGLEEMKKQYSITTASGTQMTGGEAASIVVPPSGVISKAQRDTWVASLRTAPAKLTETCRLNPIFNLMSDDQRGAVAPAMETYFAIVSQEPGVDPIIAQINANKQLIRRPRPITAIIKKAEQDKEEKTTSRKADAEKIRDNAYDCFDGNTRVVCQTGSGVDHEVQARVADVQVGWKVLAVSCAGQLCWSTVGYIHRHEQPGTVVVIRTAAGCTVRVSPNHLVYVFKSDSSSWADRRKVPAKQVRVGDHLMAAGSHVLGLGSAGQELCADGMHTQTVVSVARKADAQLVYVMNTEGRMVADGVVQSGHVNWGYYTMLHMYAIRAMWVMSLGSEGALRAVHPIFDAFIPFLHLVDKISFSASGQCLFWLLCGVVRELLCVLKWVLRVR